MLVVRPPVAVDFPAMVAIQNALLATTTYEWTEEPHTVEEMAVRADEGVVLMAELDGQPVGWAAYGDFRDARRWPGDGPATGSPSSTPSTSGVTAMAGGWVGP